jgi:hypothetical protein
MGAMGGYAFLSIKGLPGNLAGTTLEAITRPGVAGQAFWPVGYKGVPFEVLATSVFPSKPAMDAYFTAYFGLKGAILSTTDDWGGVWPNMLCHDVRRVRGFYVPASTDSANPWVLETSWTLEYVGA